MRLTVCESREEGSCSAGWLMSGLRCLDTQSLEGNGICKHLRPVPIVVLQRPLPCIPCELGSTPVLPLTACRDRAQAYGFSAGEDKQPLGEALCDTFRVDFFRQYLGNASLAVRQEGVDLQARQGTR